MRISNHCRWLACLFLSLWVTTSYAHQPSESFLYAEQTTVNESATTHWRWDIAVLDLHIALGLDANNDLQISWGEIQQQSEAIAALVNSQLNISADSEHCSFGISAIQLKDRSDGPYAVLILNAEQGCSPSQSVTLQTDFLADITPDHSLVFTYRSAESATDESTFSRIVQTSESRTIKITEQSFMQNLWEYFKRGTLHIWEGYDHLLFLLALLLPAVGFGAPKTSVQTPSQTSAVKPALYELLRIITAFTVAHSITLALAAYAVIVLPGQPVEILIAVSIVLVAALNLLLTTQHHRWPIAFAFGLLHGFGFAGNLLNNELTGALLVSNLLGFNLGVEFGQIVLALIGIPILWLIHSRAPTFYRQAILRLGSLAIIVIAMLWVVERI